MDKEKKNSKRYRSQNKEKKQVFNKKMNLKKKEKEYISKYKDARKIVYFL